MLKRKARTVTFVLPSEVGPVSVVGAFNGWDPLRHPLKKRWNGTRSVSVELDDGAHPFRYLSEEIGFFDEPEADAVEPNGYGDTHSVLVIN